MIKREVLIVLALIFILPFAAALNQTVVNEADLCVSNKVSEEGCGSLGLESQIFALLSVGKCKNELLDNSINQECFGDNGCSVKLTSQGILALKNSGGSTSTFEDNLLNQSQAENSLEWYIQINTKGEDSLCKIHYEDTLHNININSDGTIDPIGSNCFESVSDYWLKINPSCVDSGEQEYSITCNEGFETSLIFKKPDSPNYNIYSKTTSASSGGTTVEEINSKCFSNYGNCDYEGTLWATYVLNKLDYDISSYLPYLYAFSEGNEEFLPEAFLYSLTSKENFKNGLINKQIINKYWEESGDRYYDTAVALMALPKDENSVLNTEKWLEQEQGESGCWNSGNIKSTGFLLYSLEEDTGYSPGGDTTQSCGDYGGECLSEIECVDSNGTIVDYDCDEPGKVCCDIYEEETTCEGDLGGFICDSYYDEECPEGSELSGATDLYEGEICCMEECVSTEPEPTPTQNDTCTDAGGVCRDWCDENDEEVSYTSSCPGGQDCCMPSEEPTGSNWWIWVLIILIILVALGIIFRDRLKDFMDKMKFKKSKPKSGPPKRPQSSGQFRKGPLPRRPPQRRMPPKRPSPEHPPKKSSQDKPKQEKNKELDSVLKKLKDMGK